MPMIRPTAGCIKNASADNRQSCGHIHRNQGHKSGKHKGKTKAEIEELERQQEAAKHRDTARHKVEPIPVAGIDRQTAALPNGRSHAASNDVDQTNQHHVTPPPAAYNSLVARTKSFMCNAFEYLQRAWRWIPALIGIGLRCAIASLGLAPVVLGACVTAGLMIKPYLPLIGATLVDFVKSNPLTTAVSLSAALAATAAVAITAGGGFVMPAAAAAAVGAGVLGGGAVQVAAKYGNGAIVLTFGLILLVIIVGVVIFVGLA